MRIKRILSVGFIYLVLVSSTGFGGENETVINSGVGLAHAGTLLSVDSQETSQEFRQTIKVSIPNTSKTRFCNMRYDTNQLIIKVTRHVQYDCYLQKYLSAKPSIRLFIDFGTLII